MSSGQSNTEGLPWLRKWQQPKKKKNSAKLHRDRSPHARQKDVYVLLMENTVPRFDEAVPQLDEVFTRTYLLIIYLFI